MEWIPLWMVAANGEPTIIDGLLVGLYLAWAILWLSVLFKEKR